MDNREYNRLRKYGQENCLEQEASNIMGISIYERPRQEHSILNRV